MADKTLARKRARKIKMVLLDVDGVMTDGTFFLDGQGNEMKSFNTRDGLGIKLLGLAGVRTGVISGRDAPATAARARELDIEDVFTGRVDKVKILETLLERHSLDSSEVCYMGDDLYDLAIMRRVGLSACVHDAVKEVRSSALLVTDAPGGRGAVRELAEFIIRAKGLWNEIAGRFSE